MVIRDDGLIPKKLGVALFSVDLVMSLATRSTRSKESCQCYVLLASEATEEQ